MLFSINLYADIIPKISQEQAWEIIKQKIFDYKYENVNIYVCSSLIPANSRIRTYGEEEIAPNTISWFFFVDDMPYGNWSHPCRYVYVDCDSGNVSIHNLFMPPLGLDLIPLIEKKVKSAPLLYDGIKMKRHHKALANSSLDNYTYSNNYAVILSGGVAPQSNYIRYWNDCAAIFSTLVNVYGYNKDHIYVLMSDGTNPAFDRCTNYGYDSSPLDLDGDGFNDIQYAATRSNVFSVFNQLSSILTNDNNLFIYTMDHGETSGNHSYLCLWNGEKLFDYEFGNLLSTINANTINICMGQCKSGGFIDDLTNSKYVIATACKDDEDSHSLYDYGCDGYDAFVFYWTAAVTGEYPDGSSVNADINGDGYVSMREAFEFANSHDTKNETPQFSYTSNSLDKRLNLYFECSEPIQGPDVICSSTYSIVPHVANPIVNWSINNTSCSILQNGNSCIISYDNIPQYTKPILSATISLGGQVIETLTKRIVAHGTDMLVYGEQAIPGPGGGLPEINSSFYIPASAGSGLLRSNGASMMSSDTLTMHPIPILFEESNGQSLMLRDDPEYGITEIYGDAATLLTSNRFDGMTISFTGDKAPVYVTSNGSTTVGFKFQPASLLTDVQGYYNMVLHATSPGGCSDFDLYFKVIPQAGGAVGDDAISLYVGSTSLEVTFNNFEMIDLGNGVFQNVPWTLSIYKMATNTLVHSSTNYDMTKTVSMSGWTSGIYLVRVDCNGQRYSKKFLK